MRHESVAPKAATLIESMRDIGYSLETALADIIDNSITAEAKSIELLADTTSADPCIAILDDGHGMDERSLLEAMRPGTGRLLVHRDTGDLGRFGLGLKTASFSQCRRLTVVSRKDGMTCCAKWDLDDAATADWLVEIPDDPTGIRWVERLGRTGTLVLWEKLDRLVDRTRTDDRSSLIRQIDEAAEHLELVFHRFLDGERGLAKVALSLNGRQLKAIDPFHSSHPATQAGPKELIRVGGHDVTIQTFTLPHHKKVSAEDWARYAGREGYLKNQGFYVYRGRRLIIRGTWFGLVRQTELTKLARVRVDMPNDLDADWKIDVKKSSAHPPALVRERLRRIIETIGAASKRVYTDRGRRLTNDNRLPVWVRRQDKGQVAYTLNPEHPVISDFSKRLPIGMQSEFARLLEMASATIPIDSLFADISGSPEGIGTAPMSAAGLENIVETTFRTLLRGGLSSDDISDMLSAAEPFRSNWEETSRKLAELIYESDANE